MKRDDLRRAVETIEREGVLPPGSGEKVAARLGELLFPARESRSAARIVAWLGGVLIAGSLLLFVATNWEELGKVPKLVLIFGTLAALHFLGYRLAEEPGRRPALGRALTAAAMVAFGGAIGLVAQIYHLSSTWPNAILAWWLLNVPFALLTRSRLLLLIPLSIFVLWAHLHAYQWMELHLRGGSFLWSDSEVTALALLELGLAALLAALGALARASSFERFAAPLSLLGRVAGLFGLFLLAFEEFSPNRDVFGDGVPLFAAERLRELRLLLTPASAAAAAALLALGIAATATARRRAARAELADAGASLSLLLVLAAALLLMPPLTFLAANAAIVAAVIALVARGVAQGRRSDVNLAVIAFLATAMARYFEYVAEGFGPVLAFLGAGVLLLALGSLLERKRRGWVKQAGASPDRSAP
jgi:uncharacterized membrane protein